MFNLLLIDASDTHSLCTYAESSKSEFSKSGLHQPLNRVFIEIRKNIHSLSMTPLNKVVNKCNYLLFKEVQIFAKRYSESLLVKGQQSCGQSNLQDDPIVRNSRALHSGPSGRILFHSYNFDSLYQPIHMTGDIFKQVLLSQRDLIYLRC